VDEKISSPTSGGAGRLPGMGKFWNWFGRTADGVSLWQIIGSFRVRTLVKSVSLRVGASLRHNRSKGLVRSAGGIGTRLAWEIAPSG
jgi:hypothetical protein